MNTLNYTELELNIHFWFNHKMSVHILLSAKIFHPL